MPNRNEDSFAHIQKQTRGDADPLEGAAQRTGDQEVIMDN
jgi:hypothetical protein